MTPSNSIPNTGRSSYSYYDVAFNDKRCDHKKSVPSVVPKSMPIIVALLLAAELGFEETVGSAMIVTGELETGSDGDGRNEDVELHKQSTFRWTASP